MTTGYIAVLTTLPDADSARTLARDLVELGLAACVNVLAPCVSLYHWQGKTETAQEVPLLIKARADSFAAIEQAISARHPYQVPEIIALPITHGSQAYLAWLAAAGRT